MENSNRFDKIKCKTCNHEIDSHKYHKHVMAFTMINNPFSSYHIVLLVYP